jgi:hypothetical protein
MDDTDVELAFITIAGRRHEMMRNHTYIVALRALLDNDSRWHVLRHRRYLTQWENLNARNKELLEANEADIRMILDNL